MPGCDAVFTGESERDVLFEAMEHARKVHGLNDHYAQMAVQVLDNMVEAPAY